MSTCLIAVVHYLPSSNSIKRAFPAVRVSHLKTVWDFHILQSLSSRNFSFAVSNTPVVIYIYIACVRHDGIVHGRQLMERCQQTNLHLLCAINITYRILHHTNFMCDVCYIRLFKFDWSSKEKYTCIYKPVRKPNNITITFYFFERDASHERYSLHK
jgi:hypothetical protein